MTRPSYCKNELHGEVISSKATECVPVTYQIRKLGKIFFEVFFFEIRMTANTTAAATIPRTTISPMLILYPRFLLANLFVWTLSVSPVQISLSGSGQSFQVGSVFRHRISPSDLT